MYNGFCRGEILESEQREQIEMFIRSHQLTVFVLSEKEIEEVETFKTKRFFKTLIDKTVLWKAKQRKDGCGAWIQWNLHGDTTENGSGWEIDHFKPVAKDGGDELSNLQPLQWQNNRKKSDDYPASNYCVASAK